MSYIELKNVKKEYIMGEVKIIAAHDVSFEIEKGELVVILGPSGAGKTTILNLLGGMDNATSGSIIVDGEEITKLKRKELIGYRRNSIGKNPLDPKTVLEQVGLKDRINNFPAQLSGGEQQRVSIARAIAKNPKLLLCDEPTGALDSKTGIKILELLQKSCRELGMTTIIITHNAIISEIADKVIRLKNGTIEEIKKNRKPKNVKELDW